MKEGQKSRYMVFKWLKTNYWSSLLVCLLVFILGGSVSAYGISIFRLSDFLSQFFGTSHPFYSIVFLIAFVLLISLPISVGNARFFLRSLEGASKMSDLLYTFQPTHYWNAVRIECVRYLISVGIFTVAGILGILIIRTTAGTLLLFGVALMIAMPLYYKYRLAPYILAQHPKMNLKEVFNTSDRLMSNRRWDLFIIDISFVGLLLVGSLFFGVGGLLVAPYYEGTVARYYLECVQLDPYASKQLEKKESEIMDVAPVVTDGGVSR